MTRDERERIRLDFLKEFRDSPWFSSVSVRPNAEHTYWCISVGVSDDAVDLPNTFEDLPLVWHRSGRAVHAVAYPDV